MSIAANFPSYRFKTDLASVTAYKDGLQVQGMATYNVGPAVNPTYCKEWKTKGERSFMIGLLVNEMPRQEVDVWYKDKDVGWVPLAKENGPGEGHCIVDQLNVDPGFPSGKRWVAFTQPDMNWDLDDSQIAAGIIQFAVQVGIYPTVGPEFIPFVGRHFKDKQGDGSFKEGNFSDGGHMPSSWYVPKNKRKTIDGRVWVYGPLGRQWL